jgi:hypothetical protein
VPAFAAGISARLLEAWGATRPTAADFDLRSPVFHDNTRGLRFAYIKPAAGKPQRFLTRGADQAAALRLGRADGRGERHRDQQRGASNILEYFDNLPGADQRLLWAEVASRIIDMVGSSSIRLPARPATGAQLAP